MRCWPRAFSWGPATRPSPPTSIAGATPGELSASAVGAPDGRVRLVLVDYDPPGSTPLAVRLRVPRALAGGSVLRLTAPSPAATTGTRLGGRAVAADGTWTTPPTLPAVYGRTGALAVQIDPSSAAVVTLAPRRRLGRAAHGALKSRSRRALNAAVAGKEARAHADRTRTTARGRSLNIAGHPPGAGCPMGGLVASILWSGPSATSLAALPMPCKLHSNLIRCPPFVPNPPSHGKGERGNQCGPHRTAGANRHVFVA